MSARRRRAAGMLALAMVVAFATLALLLFPLTGQVSAQSPSGAPAAPAADTPTVTPTPPAGPPTLTLVSPSSASGPVGARLTLAGDNWSGTVSIGAVLSPADCSNKSGWAKAIGSPKASSSGHLSYSFTWPSSLAQTSGPYEVCATNASGTQNVNYQVLSASAPSLAFSVPTAQVGTLLTINGNNFFGAGAITITAQSTQNGQRLISTVTPLDNGSFSVPFTPTVRDVGTVTIHASSASENGAQPAISVSSKIKVIAAATATPTLGPTPTTAVSLGGTSTSNGSGASPTAIVLAVVAILFALLAIAGVIIYLMIRRRGANGGPDGQDPGYYGGPQPTGYGSYDETAYGGAVYGNDPTGAYNGQFGRSGYQNMAGPPGGQSVGGVAMWDDPQFGEDDAGPGPDWHPRPMTGKWRTPDASDLSSGGGYNPGAVDPRDAAGYAPPDPWASEGTDPYGTSRAPASNYGYGRPGPGQGVNVPSRGGPGQQGRNPWGESWRDAPPGRQSGYPRQPSNDEEPDDPNGYTGW